MLWNFSDEQVLFCELSDVGSDKVRAVGECTALFVVEVEVAAFIFDELELVFLFKFDEGGVEGLVHIAADLGLGDIDAGEILDDGGEPD